MTLHAEPPLDEWCPMLPAEAPPRIATGHQPWFWHPGILVKYLAASQLARATSGEAIDLIVDQDTLDALATELPVVIDERIEIETMKLAELDAAVPVGMQPPLPMTQVLAALANVSEHARRQHGEALSRFQQEWKSATKTEHASLADQVHAVLRELLAPFGVRFDRTLRATTLLTDEAGQRTLNAMLTDARACVKAYNAAALAAPEAGVARLSVEPDRVELPLWYVAFGQPRQRVFADLADAKPIFTLADGSPISTEQNLAPRALLLTALMRSTHADLFIHGTGGGLYDKVTEQWWQAWRGESLSPATVISADVHLPFDAPLADAADLRRAVWFAHHLPHNIDRHLPDESNQTEFQSRKATILQAMADTTNRQERGTLFGKLKQLNAEMTERWPQLLKQAERDVKRQRVGMANRKAARRRDWFFGLYPHAALAELAELIGARLSAAGERVRMKP